MHTNLQAGTETLRTDSSTLSTELHQCQQNYVDMSAMVAKQAARIANLESAAQKRDDNGSGTGDGGELVYSRHIWGQLRLVCR